MKKSSVSSKLSSLKSSLLVDFNWQWIGSKLSGVNVLIFQHFKNCYESYSKEKDESSLQNHMDKLFDYVTKEISHLPSSIELYREIFEYLRGQLLSSFTKVVDRVVSLLDRFLTTSNDPDIISSIARRKMMKTLSVVGRRLRENREDQMACKIFSLIKNWAEEFSDKRDLFPHIWETYIKLRDKHGIVFPSLSPSTLKKNSTITSMSPLSLSSPKRLNRNGSSMILKLSGFDSQEFSSNAETPRVNAIIDSSYHPTEGTGAGTIFEYDEETATFGLTFSNEGSPQSKESVTQSDYNATVETKDNSELVQNNSQETNSGLFCDECEEEKSILNFQNNHLLSPRQPLRQNSWSHADSFGSHQNRRNETEIFNSSFNSHVSEHPLEASSFYDGKTSHEFTMSDVYVDNDRITYESSNQIDFSKSFSKLPVVEEDECCSVASSFSCNSSEVDTSSREIDAIISESKHGDDKKEKKVLLVPLHTDHDEPLFTLLSESLSVACESKSINRIDSLSISTECSTGTCGTFAWELASEYYSDISSRMVSPCSLTELKPSNQVKESIQKSPSITTQSSFSRKSFGSSIPNRVSSQRLNHELLRSPCHDLASTSDRITGIPLIRKSSMRVTKSQEVEKKPQFIVPTHSEKSIGGSLKMTPRTKSFVVKSNTGNNPQKSPITEPNAVVTTAKRLTKSYSVKNIVSNQPQTPISSKQRSTATPTAKVVKSTRTESFRISGDKISCSTPKTPMKAGLQRIHSQNVMSNAKRSNDNPVNINPAKNPETSFTPKQSLSESSKKSFHSKKSFKVSNYGITI